MATKDDLVEALARWEFSGAEPLWRTYDDVPEGDREDYRLRVNQYLPLIVDFVADWLAQDGEFTHGHMFAMRWREEMA